VIADADPGGYHAPMPHARALVVTAPDTYEIKPLTLRAPREREVLIEVSHTCISPGTEGRVAAGRQPGMNLPLVPGYALVGRVTEVGPGCTTPIGAVVFAGGSQDTGSYGRGWGGHISHAICAEGDLHRVPEGLDPQVAVLCKMCAIPWHGCWLAHPRPGERCVVIGLGPIGLLSALFFRHAGAQVLAVDTNAARVARAASFGLCAEVGLDAAKQRFPEGADVVVDATGVPAVLTQAARLLRMPAWHDRHSPRPRLVVQGSYSADIVCDYTEAFMREATILVPRDCVHTEYDEMLALLRRGDLPLARIISEVRRPEDAPAVYAELKRPGSDWITAVFAWA
jgi:3-hydroxyethyl bacteriochlorophyllide a dehydrogenase